VCGAATLLAGYYVNNEYADEELREVEPGRYYPLHHPTRFETSCVELRGIL
jgi:hypothetical protein